MSAFMDYPDFLERLQQLTDMEAVKEAYVDLGKIMKGLDCGRVAAASVAPWPGDAPDGPQFVQALQQGLQDAKRLECGMAPHIVYTSDWYSYGGHTEGEGGDGGAGTLAPRRPRGPNLHGGGALRYEADA